VRPDLPTGTVTFVFTDVEGSTSLLNEFGAEAYANALADHRAVIREACIRNGGVEVDTQGDAFFFAFPTAPGALEAASTFTDHLAANGQIRVRVGVHTGTPLLGEEGYVGHDVHRAARIAAVGHGGQVLVSAATAALVTLELTDLGEHRRAHRRAPRCRDRPDAQPGDPFGGRALDADSAAMWRNLELWCCTCDDNALT
jgi:class 3 adenylate cyclase